MPYLTCPRCGVPTYVVSIGDCPSCGTPLRAREHPVNAKLALACSELGVDCALLTEIVDGRERVRWAAGDTAYDGVSMRFEDSICKRLLEGTIRPLVPDTAAEPSLRSLPSVRDGSIAAYLGVPIRTADARLYVLCCLARERRHDLRESDVRFVQGVAESLRPLLEPAS